MELTKEYFDEQLRNFATKEDLERLASKEDIVALKTDMSELKIDVSELKINVNEIKTDVAALQDDTRSVKSTLQDMNRTLTALNNRDKEDSDGFARTLVGHGERLNAVEKSLKNLRLRQA